MRLLNLFRRHAWYAGCLDAYVDGELAAPERARFESHLSACDRCLRQVAAARDLKAALSALPEPALPRSFRLTPAMLSEPARQPTPVRASLPLNLARAGAALAIAAFGIAVGYTAISGSSSSADTAAAPASAQREAANDSAAGTAPEKSAAPDETPQLAPPGDAGVSTSGLATPVASVQPAVPSTGGDFSTDDDDGAPTERIEVTTSDGLYSVGEAAGAPADEDSESRPLVIGLGLLAGATILGWLALEIRRRSRNA